MSDRPIIFSAPMVQALLAGRKTQTRRILKPQPVDAAGTWWIIDRVEGGVIDECRLDDWAKGLVGRSQRFLPGDRLYVREAHALVPASAYRSSEGVQQAVDPNDPDRACIYREGFDRSTSGIRWRPSIHMPKWASRLTLTVTDVRVQRLHAINRDDAISEGIQRVGGGMLRWENWTGAEGQCGMSPEAAFALLWNSIHGPDAWPANPWVVAVSFTVTQGNIDA